MLFRIVGILSQIPDLRRIVEWWDRAQSIGFAVVAGPDVGMKERIEVSVDAEVDSPATGRGFDCLAKIGHIL